MVISLNLCSMKIILESDRDHPKGLLRAIEVFPFLMRAAAKPLNVIRGIKNIKRLQQVYKALEGLIFIACNHIFTVPHYFKLKVW